MKKDNRKKKIIIEIAVAGVLLLALAVAIIVDTLSTRSTVLLTEDQAQTLLNDTFENLPLTGAVTAAGIIDGANVTVNSVRYGGSREMIFSCTYETSDVLGVYKANKDSLFSDAYDYCEELRADGQMVNATKVRLFMDERITQLISEAEKVNGEIEISEGVIAAKRHIHVTPEDAGRIGIRDKQCVSVKVEGERGLVFDEVVVRVSEKFRTRMHIDTDEANAAGISGEVEAEIIL